MVAGHQAMFMVTSDQQDNLDEWKTIHPPREAETTLEVPDSDLLVAVASVLEEDDTVLSKV